jgi:hypothetical protein
MEQIAFQILSSPGSVNSLVGMFGANARRGNKRLLTCHVIVPLSVLVEGTWRSKAKGLWAAGDFRQSMKDAKRHAKDVIKVADLDKIAFSLADVDAG